MAVYALTDRWNEAIENANAYITLMAEDYSRRLPYVSESEQLQVLRGRRSWTEVLNLAMLQREDVDIANASARWILTWKAVVPELLTERARLARASDLSAAAAMFDRLGKIRSELSRLSVDESGSDEGTANERAKRLAEEELRVSRELGRLVYAGGRQQRLINVDDVRRRIAADEVLVEFVKVEMRDLRSGRKQGMRYLACVIPSQGNGDVSVFDVGKSAPIDQAIRELRRGMGNALDTIIERGDAFAEKQIQKQLSTVSDLVLKPLFPAIRDAKRWIISADHDLWLIPWAALPVDNDVYAVERHTVRHVVTGRDLLHEVAPHRVHTAVVLADPAFDVKGIALDEGSDIDELYAHRGRPLRSHDLASQRWSRLPGTAKEATAIAPKLAKYIGSQPTMLTRAAASEKRFKALRQPGVLVLSTHGFFLEDLDIDENESKRSIGPSRRRSENPLLRCGLILAGANNRRDLPDSATDDGILTGLEIVSSDLRGTQLVVLSACDTGIGEIQNGMGVVGLRHAFQLAGAEAVLASLWKIPDAETVTLMDEFWENLQGGETRDDALRLAQASMIKELRADRGSAHPFYWGAFALTEK